MALEPFELTQVRLLDGPLKVALEANRKYLLSLDEDSLLYTFRVNAKLPAPGKPLGGWEAPDIEVRGHFVGHYLSACALMYAATGDSAIKERAIHMVGELAKCQKALGGGYLSAFPESFWDRLENGPRAPWAPYYTIHKILAGMLDVYRYCGDRQALEVASGMAGYFKRRTDRLAIADMDRILNVEFGGMSEGLHDLYGFTGSPAHLELAHRFDQPAFLGPLALEHDSLSRIHANTQIPKICGAARRYELTGDERYRTIVRYFWDRIVHHRSYATGGSTSGEAWGDPDHLAHTLAPTNQECCTTYNMLKVTRYLLRWTGDPQYGDFYERAFVNGIMGTQDPATGQLMYYVPLATGYCRSFGTPTGAFWCCYGTGVETFSKLADSIYFHDADSLYVDLFIPSEVTWKGLRVEQTTGFPETESTVLTVHAERPVEATIKVRIPAWASGADVTVNGGAAGTAKPGAYCEIKRSWHDGDRVEVRLPMRLHTAPMPDDPDMVAVMRGPVVLAGLVGSKLPNGPREDENMVAPLVATSWPKYLSGDPKHPESWLAPVEGRPSTYRTVGQTQETTFVPFHEVLDQPYGIYWLVLSKDSPRLEQMRAEEEAEKKLEERIVDRVVPGDEAGERAHNLQGEKTRSGPHASKHWRDADEGGWFSWDLKTLPDTPLTLLCTYWGSEGGPRTFDILVDGEVIATQSLAGNKPGEFFQKEYPIPRDLLRGKSKVTVRFQAHPGKMAGGVFTCALLRP